MVTIPEAPAAYGFEESSGRIYSAGQGADDAVQTILDAGAGSGEGAVVVVALLPIAAAVGAIASAGREIPAVEVKVAEEALTEGLRAAASQSEFRDQFLAVAENQKRLQFVTPSGLRRLDANAIAADSADRGWTLELMVESVRLRRTSSGGPEFSLVISARARIRDESGAVVHEMLGAFESESSVFIDWAHHRGAPLRRVAEHGYRAMAEKILARLGGM